MPVAGAADADFAELDLASFDEVPATVDAALPRPRRKSRRSQRDAAGRAMPAIPVSVISVGLLVVINGLVRIMDVALYCGRAGLLAWQLTMAALVLLGVIFRVRLGWQFARIVSAIAAVLLFFALVARAVAGTMDVGVFLNVVIPMAFHLGIIAALERPTAREWFALNCPECGSHRGGSADFLFRVVRCKDCNTEW